MPDIDSELMTRTEFCQLVRIVPRTAHRWAAAGYGPVPVVIGRRPKYRRAEVRRFLQDRTDESIRRHEARAGVA